MNFIKITEQPSIHEDLVDDNEQVGTHPFSFDKKKVYHLFADYPHNMTDEEVEIFKKECPFWANFFKYRKK